MALPLKPDSYRERASVTAFTFFLKVPCFSLCQCPVTVTVSMSVSLDTVTDTGTDTDKDTVTGTQNIPENHKSTHFQ